MTINLSDAPLGKKSNYACDYDPSLLFPIPRLGIRQEIGITDEANLPFTGIDMWNVFELSWLNTKGKPVVGIAEFFVDADTQKFFESKSVKLYFNSFNQHQFANAEAVQTTIARDLSAAANGQILVNIITPQQFAKQNIQEFPGTCLDELDISTDIYQTTPELLTTETNVVEETLFSNLFKSNCLVTNQPDWGSLLIRYRGKKINHENLLKYIISFRLHNEFHEQCVERIFMDIMRVCRPEKLTVYARYTRRGGLDINLFRSNFEKPYRNIRLARQ